MIKASAITRELHSRGFSTAAAIAVAVMVVVYFLAGKVEPLTGDYGFAIPSPNCWFADYPALSLAASLVMNGSVVLAGVLMNKVHNIMRSMTGLYITFYAAMMLGVPDLSAQFYSGPLLASVVAWGLFMLFGCYRNPASSGSVYIVFAALSLLTAARAGFAMFVPAFLIVCAQMRILNLRTFIAAVLGLITPWWIIFLTPGLLQPNPSFYIGLDPIAVPATASEALYLAAVLITVLVMVLAMVLNVFKTIAYNARSRAINGAVTIMALFAVIGFVVDNGAGEVYVPVLCFCSAIQTAHYFSSRRADKSWIAICAILLIYILLFVCRIKV